MIQNNDQHHTRQTFWEVIILDKIFTMDLLSNYYPSKCFCDEYPIIRYGKKKGRFYQGCRNYGKKRMNHCKFFSWVPNSIYLDFLT